MPHSISTDLIKEELRQLSLETDWPQMAQLISTLYARHGMQQTANFATEIDLSRRTIQYLVNIATRFRALSVPMPQDISWRKIAEITPGIRGENIHKRLEFARRHNRREVTQAIKGRQI
jgi:hypothetical protein